jgi:hypothetical protein
MRINANHELFAIKTRKTRQDALTACISKVKDSSSLTFLYRNTCISEVKDSSSLTFLYWNTCISKIKDCSSLTFLYIKHFLIWAILLLLFLFILLTLLVLLFYFLMLSLLALHLFYYITCSHFLFTLHNMNCVLKSNYLYVIYSCLLSWLIVSAYQFKTEFYIK